MTEKRRGIVDPWRQVEPLRPSPRQPPREGKKDLEDLDLDADLAIPGKYVIRSKHASFDVTSTRVVTPKSALDVLADCVVDMWKVKALGRALVELGVGVRTARAAHNVPAVDAPASTLASDDASLWFANATLADGLATLARLMRSSDAQPIARKHGVTPMLTA